MRWLIGLCCLAIFHRPDGQEIRIDTHITAFQPAHGFSEHLAAGIKTVIFSGGKSFGVIETPDQVERIVRDCNGQRQ
jgi:hypothetical protein